MKRLLSLVLSLVFLVSLCACNSASVTDEMFALDTFITFNITADTEYNAQYAIAQIKNEITSLEDILSATKQGSDIYNVNNRQFDSVDLKATVVNQCTADLINRSKEISQSVDGAFDISVYPLVKLWGFDTKEYYVPSDSEIADTLEFVNYNDIEIDKNNAVTLKDSMSIDLGGIAKGYIGERVYEMLSSGSFSITKGIVNLGGMVITYNSSEKDTFNIGVEHPGTNEVFMNFETNEPYVVTSGAYQRYFKENGKVYHHILDTTTGAPSDSDISSVTIVGVDAVLADALSTAFFVMGIDKTIEYIKSHDFTLPQFFNVIILSSDMTQLYISAELAQNGYEIEKTYSDINVNIIDV